MLPAVIITAEGQCKISLIEYVQMSAWCGAGPKVSVGEIILLVFETLYIFATCRSHSVVVRH